MCLPLALDGDGPQPPDYSAAGIVNAASNEPGALAPYTYATIYGTHLANDTVAVPGADLASGIIPTSVAGVRVLVNSIPAGLCYVSPTQINFLISPEFRDVQVVVQVTFGVLAGPEVKVKLRAAAPALFLLGPDTAVATHADYSVLTDMAPSQPGEVVIFWATGLGPTVPDYTYGYVPDRAAPLRRLSEFHILLAGHQVPQENVLYAGLAPGFPGLYQINVQVPWLHGPDPEVRIALGDQLSPPGIHIPFHRDPHWYPARRISPR